MRQFVNVGGFALGLIIGLMFGGQYAQAQSYPLYQPANQGEVVDLTLTLDTNIYAVDDVLSVPAEVTGVCRVPFGTVEIDSIHVLDEDDQGQNLRVLLMNADGSIGTINGAYSPADAVARTIVGSVEINDWVDAVNSQHATHNDLDLIAKCDASGSLWLATVAREGTPTYTAAGIRVKLGLVQH